MAGVSPHFCTCVGPFISHSVASDGVGLTVGHVWSLAARVGIIRLIVYSIFFPSSKTIVSPFIDNPLFLEDSSLLVVSGGKTFMILPLVLVSSAGPSSFVYQVGMMLRVSICLLWLLGFVEHLEQMSRDPRPVVQLPLGFRNVRQMHQTRVKINFNLAWRQLLSWGLTT